jgi:hypothetical protein
MVYKICDPKVMRKHINVISHSSLLTIAIISTQNKVFNQVYVEVYHTPVDELLQFHQLN